MKNFVPRLTEHDDVITPLLRGAPRLGLALGPALAKDVPGYKDQQIKTMVCVNGAWNL